MYEFYHKYIKIKFSANLFFTGLDSLVYEIKRDDVYEDFLRINIGLILVIIHDIQSFF